MTSLLRKLEELTFEIERQLGVGNAISQVYLTHDAYIGLLDACHNYSRVNQADSLVRALPTGFVLMLPGGQNLEIQKAKNFMAETGKAVEKTAYSMLHDCGHVVGDDPAAPPDFGRMRKDVSDQMAKRIRKDNKEVIDAAIKRAMIAGQALLKIQPTVEVKIVGDEDD